MTPQEIEKAANDLIPDYIPGTHPKFYDREEAVTIFISGANLVMERVRVLEEALKWYASDAPYSNKECDDLIREGGFFPYQLDECPINDDRGAKARAALEGKE